MIWIYLLLLAASSSVSYEDAYKGYQQGEPMYVYFTAGWCGPCKAVKPYLGLLPSYCEVDIDHNPDLFRRATGQRCIPAIVRWKKGERSKMAVGRDRVIQSIRIWSGGKR